MDFLYIFLVSHVLRLIMAGQSAILCEYDHSPMNLVCNATEIIIVTKVTVPFDNCWGSHWSCFNNMALLIKNTCHQKVSCNITLKELQNNCKRFPRRMSISYHCIWRRWNTSWSEDVCSHLSPLIWCWWGKIDINHIQLHPASICSNDTTRKKTEHRIKNLCNDKRKCDLTDMENDVLHQERYVHVEYYCLDNSTRLTTRFASVGFPTSTSTIPSSSLKTDENAAYPEILVSIDDANFIIVTYQNLNKTYFICANSSIDNIASVVCRYLSNQTGRAKVGKRENGHILPFLLNCIGNESSLTECSGIDAECSSSEVVGVVCSKESNKPSGSLSANKKNGSTGLSSVGVSVGVSLIVFVAVIVILILLYARKRGVVCNNSKDKARPHIGNQCEDYTGQQDIALPNFSRDGSHENYKGMYTNSHSSDKRTNQKRDKSSKSQIYSIASNPNDYDQSTYAASEDGIYDKAHDQRHVENEANTYSHSIDDIYDTSNQQQRYDVKGDSYGPVVDTAYEATGHNQRQTGNIDNTYARAVDTAYDTAGQTERLGKENDTYD